MNGKKKEANSNQNGALNDHAFNGVPAVPSVPPPSTLSHVGGKISPRSTSPEAEDEDYDEPEVGGTDYCGLFWNWGGDLTEEIFSAPVCLTAPSAIYVSAFCLIPLLHV